ncbi:MAG: AbrB/MazE/SpoVT family DNA-binding domain-containing protein [Deltaproteobacteria bacterium]
MPNLSTTKMSSKGQVVIPEKIRKRLNLHTGMQFVVVGENNVVILKAITHPSITEFDAIIAKARSQAKSAELKRSDIDKAVVRARNRK